jgi:hypothetical protein
MKNRVVFLALAAAAATAGYFALRPAAVPPVDPATLHEGSLVRKVEPAEVFKRALWRRPAPEDKILHAERREWTKDSGQGIAHWQWFLAVEPGPALKKWLRGQNPFAVHPAGEAAAPKVEGAPEWFPRDFSDYETYAGGNGGSLVFLYSRKGDTLYATGSGTGFTPGAPEPSHPAPDALTVSTGRLPLAPPPVSTKP